MDSNDEILNILSRANDASMAEDIVNKEKEFATKNIETLKDIKKNIKSDRFSLILKALEYSMKGK